MLLISPPAVSGGVLWDIGAACGYACLILILCLYLFPVRADGLPHARLMGVSQHRLLGWIALVFATAHIVILLFDEPQVLRYLLPSAPVYMWGGAVAALCVIAAVITGISARARLRLARAPAQATAHMVLAAAFLLAVCAHAVGSSQLLGSTAKLIVVLLLLCLPPAWYALRRRPSRSPARSASHVAAVCLIALLPAPTSKQLLLEPAVQPDVIPVRFPHEHHVSVNCVTCHHNFTDHTGNVTCIACHRSARTDLVRSSEATFHVFCCDCHAKTALLEQKHGPTRACSACHH
ncbi:MAG: cytochrome c3 family protein [Steroidobacteraceae bacterium]